MRMAMKGIAPTCLSSGIIDLDMRNLLQEGHHSNDSKCVKELVNSSKLSYEVEMAVAYSSEKLANIENLLLCVVSEENDIETIDIENGDDDMSCEFFEKAFTVDLLYSISLFELREVDKTMNDLQDLISNAIRILSASDSSTLLHDGLLSKLRDSEEMLKNSKESVLEMEIQLAKLQMNSVILRQDEWQHEMIMDVKEEFLSESSESRPGIETLENAHVLRMLEKSLARELELEKKLVESKQNEVDLKSKSLLLEKVSVSMEEAAEVAWSRFLEADNASAVLMGISKDMLERFRACPFNLGDSRPEEEVITVKLKDCLSQLSAKEAVIRELNSAISQLRTENTELTRLREKVQILEKNLETSESRLKESYSSNEMLRNQIKEINFEIESLRESLHEAEIRAANAEEKASHLTDSNMELTEEIDFLKDTNGKKVGLLDEQLRELDAQFQQARASSEASLEQQHMLYSAIWDMETLIDELKQKVSKAESNTEAVEERNITLSEKNEALEKELSFLRAKAEITEEALNQADLDRKASAKDICSKTSLIIDTVMQIGSERDHILKKVNSLMKENKSMRKKLRRSKKDSSEIDEDNTIDGKNDTLSSVSEPSKKPESAAILAIKDDNRVKSLMCSADSIMTAEKEETVKARDYRKARILAMAVVVALLSILASKYFLRVERPFC